MKPIAGLLPLAVAGTILFAPEAAEALRCKGKIVKEGDPQAKVLNYCGEPVSMQQRLIYRSGVPRAWIGQRQALERDRISVSGSREELLIHDRSVVEVLVEEWTYNFGPHRLMRVVRFENGLVVDVEGLSYGYVE
jgi:hypothetical protein